MKAYVGVEYDGTTTFFDKAYKYLTLFLNLYTLQDGQPYVVFRPGGTQIDDFTKLGERSNYYPEHKPIVWIKEPERAHDDIRGVSKLKTLFQHVESDFESITDSPLGLAMQFFYDAVMSNNRRRLELALVQFMMAAEALVILENKSITKNVSKRISVLIADFRKEYENKFQDVKRLYRIRSDIVHGRAITVSPLDVGNSYKYLRKAALERLSLRHLSKKELVGKLDEIAESWEKKVELNELRQFN